MVAGDYATPACPPIGILKSILEISYLAGCAAEEGRYPQFNILVTDQSSDLAADFFRFDQARALTVSELRRLAPASEFKKSSIWVGYDDDKATIIGLLDLGTSWHRARLGFTYKYKVPSYLIIQVDRPGRMKVYQGEFHVATLVDGAIQLGGSIDFNMFLGPTVDKGQDRLFGKFVLPRYEQPRDFETFWFTAHSNVFAAIANSISISGHGGTLIIVDEKVPDVKSLLRIKYEGSTSLLQDAFVEFVNARNRVADFYERSEQQEKKISDRVFKAELHTSYALDQLAEAIRFVAQLAGCDGAIVVSSDLILPGFGAEIRAEMEDEISVLDVLNEVSRKYKECDIEQFGMRHRSAIKLASQIEETLILAVSQDGPISAVWKNGRKVYVKRGVSLVNMNMPWG